MAEPRIAESTNPRKVKLLLRRELDRYRSLYQNIPMMYFSLDVHGTVLSVNAVAADHLGYRPEELLGQPVSVIFHEDDRAAVEEQLAVCVRSPGDIHRWEFRKTRKDGSHFWVRESARAV